ncbi:MAG: uracil-DNA glycosylase [Candidatus Bathyarchaeia archaeon]
MEESAGPDPRLGLKRLAEAIRCCRKCPLHRTRNRAVPGEGPHDAAIFFIGESPGKAEDREGRPFVGRAGKILDGLLSGIGLERARVFIGNVVKCRPLDVRGRDRRPTKEEIEACSPYLDKQLELIRPRIICALGDTATRYALKRHGLAEYTKYRIGELHGRVLKVGYSLLLPMYHPSAALYKARLMASMREDFERLRALISDFGIA